MKILLTLNILVLTLNILCLILILKTNTIRYKVLGFKPKAFISKPKY